MNSERIKEIQLYTPNPDSVSVMQALHQVWNECEQESSQRIAELEAEIALKDETVQVLTNTLDVVLRNAQPSGVFWVDGDIMWQVRTAIAKAKESE